MNTLLKKFYLKLLLAHLAAALFALSVFSVPAEAMFVPAAPQQDATGAAAGTTDRATDLARIRAVLESKVIEQKLMDYGLSPEEAMARVNKLSDSQINLLATHADSLQAGGHRGTNLVVVLLLVLLIVLLI